MSSYEMEAKFHIVEKIDVLTLSPRGYRQLALPTEFVVASQEEVRPELISMMRFSWTQHYYLPSTGKVLDYRAYVDALKAQGTPQTGTSREREACDVEFWDCEGDDGHCDYQHRGNYRIVFERSDPWEFLAGVTGSQFSYSLGEKVREFSQVDR